MMPDTNDAEASNLDVLILSHLKRIVHRFRIG